jgi:hypothetical protein
MNKGAFAEIRADVAAARDRDPAAQGVSTFEILTSWAGVQALLAHRVSHALRRAGVPLLPRTIAYLTRAITGVEIHPAAEIGSRFFIDHGSGVVIGETAKIAARQSPSRSIADASPSLRSSAEAAGLPPCWRRRKSAAPSPPPSPSTRTAPVWAVS